MPNERLEARGKSKLILEVGYGTQPLAVYDGFIPLGEHYRYLGLDHPIERRKTIFRAAQTRSSDPSRKMEIRAELEETLRQVRAHAIKINRFQGHSTDEKQIERVEFKDIDPKTGNWPLNGEKPLEIWLANVLTDPDIPVEEKRGIIKKSASVIDPSGHLYLLKTVKGNELEEFLDELRKAGFELHQDKSADELRQVIIDRLKREGNYNERMPIIPSLEGQLEYQALWHRARGIIGNAQQSELSRGRVPTTSSNLLIFHKAGFTCPNQTRI